VPVATAVCCGLSPRNSGRLPKPSASDKACHASFITSAPT
jgi:hypothetical protein